MPSRSQSGKRAHTGATQPGRATTTLAGPIAPVMAAPSPRVLWEALNAQIGLALWLRTPLPELSRQIDGVMQGTEFDIVAQGTADDIPATIADQLPLWRGKPKGPLVSDVSILATLFSQLSGASCVKVQLIGDLTACVHLCWTRDRVAGYHRHGSMDAPMPSWALQGVLLA